MKWMAHVVAILACITALPASGAVPANVDVPRSGETTLGQVMGKGDSASLDTRLVAASDVPASLCAERARCSMVRRLSLRFDGQAVFVPVSSFAGLADVSRARLERSGALATLVLEGGDASESYVARIEFDGARVVRRTLESALVPDVPSEVTRYHEVPL